jgi:desulfoferrodoxin-like iron-binding protein
MTELNQNYKCNVCGNLVKIIQAGQGSLACCAQPMELIIEETVGQPTIETASPMPEEIKVTEEVSNPETKTEPEENPSL